MEWKYRWLSGVLCTVFLSLAAPAAFNKAWAFQTSCPASISTGQPACGSSNDVGSNAPSIKRTKHLGNPVDVASGNKYQSDVDVRMADSHMSFLRHYNSAQSNINIGIGNGWRHSYSVMLSKHGDNQLQIVQSDGRRILFNRVERLFVATDASDGSISVQPDGRRIWALPDGRQFLFVGSFLAAITFEGEELLLHYRDTRLASVTDDFGRSLEFEYAPGAIGLPTYAPTEDGVPAGHLKAIVLPDSTRVEYEYDHQQNLVSVEYPRGSIRSRAKHYGYSDPINNALLTERANALEVPLARWSYDDHERVSSYRSGWNIRADGSDRGLPDLRFQYLEGATPDGGITSVIDREGNVRKYEWRVGEGRNVQTINETYSPNKRNSQLTGAALDSRLEQNILERKLIDDKLTVLSVGVNGYPKGVRYFSYNNSQTSTLEAKYGQDGKLLELIFTDELIEPVLGEGLFSSDKAQFELLESSDEYVEGIYQRGWIKEKARILLENSTVPLRENITINLSSVSFTGSNEFSFEERLLHRKNNANGSNSSPNAFCSNALYDCVQLRRIMYYAEISQCAYLNANCQTGLVNVNPTQLGLVPTDLVEGAFRASIFFDSQSGEYVVSFAGTDAQSAGDWVSNAQQELGMSSFQYEKAIRLARQLSFLNPGLSFSFTGHSLGGGLATAAVAAGHGDAVVFNPSGFTRQSAATMSVSYTRAEQHTDVFSVFGEMLRVLQAGEILADPPGDFHSMRAPGLSWIFSNSAPLPLGVNSLSVPIALHSMDAVIESISEHQSRNFCPP